MVGIRPWTGWRSLASPSLRAGSLGISLLFVLSAGAPELFDGGPLKEWNNSLSNGTPQQLPVGQEAKSGEVLKEAKSGEVQEEAKLGEVQAPTVAPTATPTVAPTLAPTFAPTEPTIDPTDAPPGPPYEEPLTDAPAVTEAPAQWETTLPPLSSEEPLTDAPAVTEAPAQWETTLPPLFGVATAPGQEAKSGEVQAACDDGSHTAAVPPSYILGEFDQAECPPDSEHITDLATCAEAVQFLNIEVSNIPSDGIGPFSIGDTASLTNYISKREIQATDAVLEEKVKPYGCYMNSDKRVVNGMMSSVTTVWINHDQNRAGKHDDSAPICKVNTARPFFLASQDTVACPRGYNHILDVATCAQAVQFLGISLDNVGQLNGGKTAESDTAALQQYLKSRIIPLNSPIMVEKLKPQGCYFDHANRVVDGHQAKVGSVWINLDTPRVGPHDNSAPICALPPPLPKCTTSPAPVIPHHEPKPKKPEPEPVPNVCLASLWNHAIEKDKTVEFLGDWRVAVPVGTVPLMPCVPVLPEWLQTQLASCCNWKFDYGIYYDYRSDETGYSTDAMLEKNAECTARFMPPWGGLFPGSGEDAGIVKPDTFLHLVGTLLPSFIIVPLLALIYKRRVTDKRLPLHPAKDLPAEFSLKDAPYDFHYGFWSCLGDLRTCCCVCGCPAIKLADYISQTAPFYALGFLDGGGPLSHGCGFWTVVFFCLGANAAIYIADFFTPGEESYSNIYRCIVYFCTMAKWRHKVRQRLGAPKTWSVSRPWHKALLDHLAWYFCWPCAMTQEARELDRAQGVTSKCCCIHQDSPAGYTRMPKVGDPVTIEQPQGLELVFRDQDGAERKFLFTEVPLGLGYRTGTSDRRLTDDKQPVTVTKIVDGSIAQKLGVKLGMRLLEVDGEKVEFESRSLVDYKIKLAKERRLNKENERIERVEQQLMTQGSPNRNESQRTLYT